MAILLDKLISKYTHISRFLNSENRSPRLSPLIADLFERYQQVPLLTRYVNFKEVASLAPQVPATQLARYTKLFQDVVNRLDPKFYIKALDEKEYDLSLFLQNKLRGLVRSSSLAQKLKSHFERGVEIGEFLPYMFQAIKQVINGADDQLLLIVEEICHEALEAQGIVVQLTFEEWKSMAKSASPGSNLQLVLTSPLIQFEFEEMPIDRFNQASIYFFPADFDPATPIHTALYQLQDALWSKAPLLRAIQANDMEGLRILLQLGANPNAVDSKGNSILVAAAALNHTEAVEILLAYHADPNLVDQFGRSPLIYACNFNNLQLVRSLCQKRAKNLYDINHHSAFHSACYYGSFDSLRVLVEFFGAEPLKAYEKIPYQGDFSSKSLIHIACAQRDLTILRFLVEQGCSLRDPDSTGNHSLHYAATLGWLPGVEFILEKDPSTLNRKNHKNENPIVFAIRNHCQQVFNLLLPGSRFENNIFEHAVLSTPAILRSVLENKRWVETQDAEGNSPLHLLIKNYPNEVHKNNFREKFHMVVERSHWLMVNHQGETPYELALRSLEENDVLNRIIFVVGGYKNHRTSPLLYKPLEFRHTFPCQAVVSQAVYLAQHAVRQDIPEMKRKVLMLLDLFPEKTVWNNWIDHKLRAIERRGAMSQSLLDLVILANKSESELLSLIFEVDKTHYSKEVAPLPLPPVDPTIRLEELEDFFKQLIDETHPPIFSDPDDFGNAQVIPLPLLRTKFSQMMRVIQNREDFIGVWTGNKKNVFYDRLDHQIRLIIQALRNPEEDKEKIDSCIVDIARGACYCAKRWTDESLAHVKLFYNIQDGGLEVLRELHQARLAVIAEISKVGYHGNWTHNEAKFRHLLKESRGIFEEGYNDPLGAQLTLAQLLSAFDSKNTSNLLILTILSSINAADNKLEKKTLIQAELRDVVTELSQDTIRTKAINIIQTLQQMDSEGATIAEMRAFLAKKEIIWNEDRISEQWERGFKSFFEKLQEEVINASFHDMHEELLEKNVDGEYRLFNQEGVEDAAGLQTHYRALASVFLLVKHQALRPLVPILSPSPYSTPAS